MPRYQDYSKIPPQQIVAEVDDDFPRLAEKLGVDVGDLVNANPDTTKVSAGAAYNVPTPTFDVPTFDPEGGETYAEWLAGLGGATSQPAQDEPLNVFKDAYDWLEATGQRVEDVGGIPGLLSAFSNWLKGNITGSETGFTTGVGTGAGIGGGFQPPTQPPIQPPRTAEFADFRQAEADAAFRDLEAQRFQGTLGISDIADRPVDPYQNLRGLESAYLGQSGAGPYVFPENVTAPGSLQPTPEAQTAEAALRQMWGDIYLDPENKGRGGGIVGWIEERTGITIDPEIGYTEDVLAKMLEVFRPDELNYLESQGIIVPAEGFGLPSDGGFSTIGNYRYPTPSYYGGGQPESRQQYPARLGLVSWSI